MITTDDLRTYVGASAVDDAFIAACLATAKSLIAVHVGAEVIGGIISESVVPEPVLDRATLEVGSELFHRRQAPNGIAQFASPDGGQGVRVARDPMVAARPILAPFVPLGFA